MTTENIDYNSWKTFEEGVEFYYKYHPTKFYLSYPEFIVTKLGLDEKILDILEKDISKRTREHIRDWMKTISLSYDDLNWVGW
jgi:hypothetical protein